MELLKIDHILRWQEKDDDVFKVQMEKNGDIYLFRRKYDVYVHNIKSCNDIVKKRVTLVNTVSNNMKQFSSREIKMARLARELSCKMGNPSEQALIRMIKEGRIINCPITITDIENANKIWGRNMAYIKGKTTSHKAPIVTIDSNINYQTYDKNITIMIDIMYVETIPFLISVSKPLDMILINQIKNRKTITIFNQLNKQLGTYLSRGYNINTIRCDPENGLITLQELLNHKGFQLDISEQEEAVPQVERKIRTIKERARGIINTLPYNLPLKFIPYLIYFCTTRMNMTPNKDNLCSSWELLYGRKVNYNNLKASFGDYCQAHRNKIDNTMNMRTDGCITLYDTGNIEGTWYLRNNYYW